MREFQDILDLFPYCLFLVLPVFILLSPMNPCQAAHDFPVHRLAQYELSGQLYGSKLAAISMEARSRSSSKVLRKLVVSKAEDMSISTYNELSSNGAGGILLLVPPSKESLKEKLETFLSFEEHAISGEMEVPVYYAEESPELISLLEDLEQSGSGGDGKQATSGAQALLDGIISNGFQLVASSGNPKVLTDQNLVSVQANFNGRGSMGEEDSLPTILVVAHYDSSGAAPGLAKGADSNGSGVALIMELARIWSQVYRSARSRPNYNLVFLLSGGGKINFLGTKKWLDEHKEDQNSELLSNLKMAICLDSLGLSERINMFVSKPPKEGTVPFHFLNSLEILSKKMFENKVKINLVHKKINLANEFLAWEHERFSIHKLSALTLSHYESSNDPSRNSILDTKVDAKVLHRNALLIGEAIACTVFNLDSENCQGTVFTGSSAPSSSSLDMWISELTSQPRATSLLLTAKNPNQVPLIKALTENLKVLADEVSQHVVKRDKRDPEWTFYDSQTATMNSYRVKPAVFDLVLTLSIAGYLGLVYLLLMKWMSAYTFFASFAVSSSPTHKKNGVMNGNGKIRSH